MADRFDVRLPFLHLTSKEEDIQFLPAKDAEKSNMWQPLEQEIFLNASHIMRIDCFDDSRIKHIYMDNGDFYRIKGDFSTKCL